jgi:hypothetical protein
MIGNLFKEYPLSVITSPRERARRRSDRYRDWQEVGHPFLPSMAGRPQRLYVEIYKCGR